MMCVNFKKSTKSTDSYIQIDNMYIAILYLLLFKVDPCKIIGFFKYAIFLQYNILSQILILTKNL